MAPHHSDIGVDYYFHNDVMWHADLGDYNTRNYKSKKMYYYFV